MFSLLPKELTLLLSFSVSDDTGVVNSVTFTVNVLDVNDVSPVFAPNAYTGYVQENSAQGQFYPYLMDSPIVINWVSPLSFLGASGVIFNFLFNCSMKFL